MECWQVPKQNLYAQHRKAHIAADQDPRVYKESWNTWLTTMKRKMLILLTHTFVCLHMLHHYLFIDKYMSLFYSKKIGVKYKPDHRVRRS